MRQGFDTFEDRLYLPLSEDTARALAVSESAYEFIDGLTNAEIAAFLLVQNLPKLDKSKNIVLPAERILVNLIAWGAERSSEQGGNSLAEEAKRLFSAEKLSSGIKVSFALGIEFLSPDDVVLKDYLLADGTWDRDFRARHYKKVAAFKNEVETLSGGFLVLSDPQSSLLRSFLAEKDESLHIQGYAGTGKTHLISSLVDFMDPYATLVLSKTQTQLYSLTTRLKNSHIAAKTFMGLASELLAPIYPHLAATEDDYIQVSDSVIAQALNIGSVGGMHSSRVVATCRRTVLKFCESGSNNITAWHLPYIKDFISAVDREVLVNYATRIWEATISPPCYEIRLPIRGYHRIKFLSLCHEVIPERYKHVIVDESHDLTRPVLRLLDRSPQSVITLGDEYQSINGPVFQRSRSVRQRDITLSVRAGKNIENILNPLIEAHPSKIKLPFEGGGNSATRVEFYSDNKVPSKPTTILVESEWGMFEWFQRLSHAGARFSLLPGSKRGFVDFMVDCINLFHRGKQPTHRALFFYTSWRSLAESQFNNSVFEKVEAMIAKGFDTEQLNVSMRLLDRVSSGGYQLGMVKDVRNVEFDSVMLVPELLGEIKPGDVLGFDRKLCSLYTGGSRAKFELLVPGNIEEWIGSQRYIANKTS